ncbi:MAG: TM1266 family iron-only hydrogenase system putative regulator [Halanaerobiaceae bacterium]
MDKRIGVIGIVIEDRKKVNTRLNQILSEFGNMIIGRMGVPSQELELAMIALIVEGTTDEVSAMTGQLGNLPGITLKSALTSKKIDNRKG